MNKRVQNCWRSFIWDFGSYSSQVWNKQRPWWWYWWFWSWGKDRTKKLHEYELRFSQSKRGNYQKTKPRLQVESQVHCLQSHHLFITWNRVIHLQKERGHKINWGFEVSLAPLDFPRCELIKCRSRHRSGCLLAIIRAVCSDRLLVGSLPLKPLLSTVNPLDDCSYVCQSELIPNLSHLTPVRPWTQKWHAVSDQPCKLR